MCKPGDGMIRVGDPTSHGGKVITGQQNYIVDGVAVACVGDKVTCPQDGHNGVTTIVEGHPTIRINGKAVAFDGCRTACGARLMSMARGYHILGSEDAASAPKATPATHRDPAAAAAARHRDEEKDGLEPGFHIVRKAGYRDQIKQQLLPSPSPDVDAMFYRLNSHLPDYVLPGSMVVLSDPDNQMCMAEEQQLQDQARMIQASVQQLKPSQADIMMTNWDAMLELSESLSDASTEMGVTATALEPLKAQAADAVDDLANAWDQGQEYVKANGEKLLSKIQGEAQSFMAGAFELSETAQALKLKLGVKTNKLVHRASQAFEGFPTFNVPTVMDGIRKASSIAKTLDAATYLGIALDVTATQLKVKSSCTAYSTTKQCRKAQIVGYSALAGRTGFSFIGAGGGKVASRLVCLGIGNPAGVLTCSIVSMGAGGFAGVEVGNRAGTTFGEVIYEVTYGGEEKGSE